MYFNIKEKAEQPSFRSDKRYILSAYTFNGKQDSVDEDGNPRIDNIDTYDDAVRHDNVFALKLQTNDRTDYYVLMHRSTGELYNPLGPYGSAERHNYELLRVSKEVFESYVGFLRTRNALFIKQAQIARGF